MHIGNLGLIFFLYLLYFPSNLYEKSISFQMFEDDNKTALKHNAEIYSMIFVIMYIICFVSYFMQVNVWGLLFLFFCFLFWGRFFLVGSGFEFRTSHLQSRHSTNLIHTSSPFCSG
jgi:Ca2+/Na+ antiporter